LTNEHGHIIAQYFSDDEFQQTWKSVAALYHYLNGTCWILLIILIIE